ncbi:MAG: mRNA surveillance protein pelota [Candidatus Hydrothermarchaeales archaeon]
MKIIHSDLKEGKIKIKPENLDDLWYLKSIIETNDIVSSKTYRRVKDDTKLRADTGTRKPVFLSIQTEDVEFHAYINRLRITGVIKAGPEDIISLGSHHTLEIKPNEILSITKHWKKWQLDRLKDAVKSAKEPLVLIVGLEEGEAEFAILRKYGIDFVVRVTTTVSGKKDAKAHEIKAREFYGEVAKKIGEVLKQEEINVLILCGPGFAKDNLFDFLKEKYPEIAKLAHRESAGTWGRVGIQEVIKKGVIDRVVEESRVSYETMLMEKVLSEISKNTNLATYGIEEVKNAMKYGAIETLLLSDVFLRKYERVDDLIEGTKKKKGNVAIISTEHEAGERLEAIGSIAAILRFPIE